MLKDLSEDIQKRKTQRARKSSMEEKLLDGPRLFRLSCEGIKAGLRLDFPEASELDINRKLNQRVYGTQ